MQFGFCANIETAAKLSGRGFDFFEAPVADLLRPMESESAFEQSLRRAQDVAMPCPSVNMLLPGSMKVTGPSVDARALADYAAITMGRAKRAGVKVVVLGSGGARTVPEGFDRARAWQQLLELGSMLGQAAASNGVIVAAEPLNRGECNILNTVTEVSQYVRELGQPAVRVLVDSFHWGVENEPAQAILDAAPQLAHVHVATWPGRVLPGMEQCDLQSFARAIRAAGYDGLVALESFAIKDPQQFPASLRAFRDLFA